MTAIKYDSDSLNDVELMMKRFPAFMFPLLQALKAGEHPELRDNFRARLAVNISGSQTLERILGITPEEFNNFYPDMKPVEHTTDDTINSFLNRFGAKNGPLPDELPQPVPSVWIPGDDLTPIREDEFKPQPEETSDTKAENSDRRDPKLTMSLAAAMVKSRDYKGALKIITDLNLKNPEKSIYFADQIRFLRKLIINESKK